MRNPFGSAVHIGLSKRGIAVMRTGWRRDPALLAEHPLNESEATPERVALQLHAILNETACIGMPATIVLADEWVRLFMATPPHNAGGLQDCWAAAAMRFQALYGDLSDGWQLEADWDARHPFLACAIPKGLLDALRMVARESALQLISVAPHYIAAWNKWHDVLQAGAWFGAVNDNLLTLGMIDRTRLFGVRMTALPAGAGNDLRWLTAHLGREALKMNFSVPTHIQLCGQVPALWLSPEPDALQCARLDARQGDLACDTLSPEVALAWSGVRR
jgi:hypothetical protein